MRRRRCIKSLLSIESSACTASDLSRRCLAERSAYTCITSLLPSRRYYARLHDIRERIASALEGSGRRFVACNGHVHPLSLASPPVIYDRPVAIYTYRAHTLASLKSHRAFWTWNMERPPRGGEPPRILRGSSPIWGEHGRKCSRFSFSSLLP